MWLKGLLHKWFCFHTHEVDREQPLGSVSGKDAQGSKGHKVISARRICEEDFELLKLISSGGYSKVYLCKKKDNGQIYALKVMRKSYLKKKNVSNLVKNERDILAAANQGPHNKFVVKLEYAFTGKTNLYCVLEYAPGGDLYSLLKNTGCIEEDVARGMFREVVLALEYIHSQGVVHKDLKPENLLIGKDGHIKLTDFGLSQMGLLQKKMSIEVGSEVDNALSATSSEGSYPSTPLRMERMRTKYHRRKEKAVHGTPDYIAPEVIQEDAIGPAVDWWALGVVLYEAIVGIPPFTAETPQEIFTNIVHGAILWPSSECISMECRDLIERLLTRDPEKRLGCEGAEQVKCHAFWKTDDWDDIGNKEAPFIPLIESEDDTSYFRMTGRNLSRSESDEESIRSMEEYNLPTQSFPDFSYNNVRLSVRQMYESVAKFQTL